MTSVEAERGTERPGGRTARNTAAVLDATLAELGDRGYAGLTVDRVAARSGVHKATIYRRWGGVDGLLAAALTQSARDDWTPPSTGSLRTDLVALGREVVRSLSGTERIPVATAAMSAALASERAAAALRDFFDDRIRRSARVVEEAIGRGEVPPGTDAREVVRSGIAPLYFRLCVSHEPVDDPDIERAARVASDAAAAGAFAEAD